MADRKLVVIPAYNESDSVVAVIESVRDAMSESWDIVVIDDGSDDATGAKAAEAGARVVRTPFNLGIGGAVQTGFIYRRDRGYSQMGQIDGDGQHKPAAVESLQAAMTETGADMICGSRFLSDDYTYPAPISRRTGIHIFAFLLSTFLRQRITDPTSGFRLYNRRAIELFASDYPHDYPEVEVVMMLHQHRLKMKEVPVKMNLREEGVSSISTSKSAYYMVKVLLALFIGLLRTRDRQPAEGA